MACPFIPCASLLLCHWVFGQRFMFQFTKAEGTPYYVHCLQCDLVQHLKLPEALEPAPFSLRALLAHIQLFPPQQNQPATPASDAVLLCLVTRLPWFTFFRDTVHAFNTVYQRSNYDRSVLEACLTKLSDALKEDCSQPTGMQSYPHPFLPFLCDNPPPCTDLLLALPHDVQVTLRVPDGQRSPVISELPLVGTLPRCLSWHNVFHLLAALQAERRILITSSDLNRLTCACFGCTLSVFPMQWQHVFIPILPEHLLAYCEAPMPYILGVHKSLLPEIQSRSMEDHVLVDLDEDLIISPFTDTDNWPTELVAGIKPIAKRIRQLGPHAPERHEDILAFAEGITDLYVQIMAGSTQCIVATNDREISFYAEKFKLLKPRVFGPMLEHLVEMQMFQQFIELCVAKNKQPIYGSPEAACLLYEKLELCFALLALAHLTRSNFSSATMGTDQVPAVKSGGLLEQHNASNKRVTRLAAEDDGSTLLATNTSFAHAPSTTLSGRQRSVTTQPSGYLEAGRPRAALVTTEHSRSVLQPARSPPRVPVRVDANSVRAKPVRPAQQSEAVQSYLQARQQGWDMPIAEASMEEEDEPPTRGRGTIGAPRSHRANSSITDDGEEGENEDNQEMGSLASLSLDRSDAGVIPTPPPRRMRPSQRRVIAKSPGESPDPVRQPPLAAATRASNAQIDLAQLESVWADFVDKIPSAPMPIKGRGRRESPQRLSGHSLPGSSVPLSTSNPFADLEGRSSASPESSPFHVDTAVRPRRSSSMNLALAARSHSSPTASPRPGRARSGYADPPTHAE
ncbi:uncharacterized protein MONBRDRAFT_28397 [Monosiga brevicollis MX1]|uniref:UDENN domain-containing protein n=1 Tax=Monosiga brevicollis TaxID=81824 RepID=A9V822_MONBE|nr:uncharacterized protein MONBRDRAFT_28397 [Monosiga brevicollis MX1]EDQ86264.1 predicted protein [Monosiga brevicollis MX1]|eukprot:XP_001748934.1 hypothetical protein [Monosiga brevicollis MX1]